MKNAIHRNEITEEFEPKTTVDEYLDNLNRKHYGKTVQVSPMKKLAFMKRNRKPNVTTNSSVKVDSPGQKRLNNLLAGGLSP